MQRAPDQRLLRRRSDSSELVVPARQGDQIAAAISRGIGPARAGARLRIRARQKAESLDVTRPHDSKVAVIKRRDLGEAQPLGDSDHRGFDDAKRQVQVDCTSWAMRRKSCSSSSAM